MDPQDFLYEFLSLVECRKRVDASLRRMATILDEMGVELDAFFSKGVDDDLEETNEDGGDVCDEPHDDDRCDDEPSLGGVAMSEYGNQVFWSQGASDDSEEEHDGTEPHDGDDEPDSDGEPSLGWRGNANGNEMDNTGDLEASAYVPVKDIPRPHLREEPHVMARREEAKLRERGLAVRRYYRGVAIASWGD